MKTSISTAALAAALTIALPQTARGQVTPPLVPGNLVVDPPHQAYLIGHAYGTQNYVCLPSGAGFSWILYGPQATLFDGDGEQQITHFLSPNPDENGTLRATWQHSRDSSAVWAFAVQTYSASDWVAPGAIPWLKLQVVGKENGPTGGLKLTRTTFIQRVNTQGGIAPATGCAAAGDVGRKALVPYTTDYVFYRP
jgi:Protein of unknown function (DUF3455)